MRGVVVAVLLLLLGAPTRGLAESWLKETAPSLGPLLNRLENAGDRLRHEYKISLRRADRWLPRGDEAVLWSELEKLEGSLNQLENGFAGPGPVELERRMAFFLDRWEGARAVFSRVPTSRRVRSRWEELDALVAQLRVERDILRARNAAFERPPESRWDRAVEPERHFGRREYERVRDAIQEIEDQTNRLKTALRGRAPSRRAGDLPIGSAALDRADLRESLFALERHADALQQAFLSRGASTLRGEVSIVLDWGRRAALRVDVEGLDGDAGRHWSELVLALDELAGLYSQEPIDRR